MRRILITMAAAAFVLGFARPAPAAQESDHARLMRYAEATWASFVAMVDTPSGLPTDQLHADGTTDVADVDDEHRRLHVERGRRRAARHHRARRAGHPALAPPSRTLEHMERHQPDGQFYNWYDHRDGAKLTTWPPNRMTPARPDPVVGRQRVAGDRAADRAQRRTRAVRARRRDLRLDGLRLLLRARTRTGSCSTTRRRPGHRPVLLRHRRLREPDRRLHRHRQGRAAAQGVLRPLADLPGHLRLLVPGDQARPASPGTYDGVSVYDGSYPYGGTRLTPSWGGSMFEALMPALFVPEETWGAGLVAGEPPLHRRRADRPRPERGAVRRVGLLAVQHPRGRLRRVRRRRRRHGPERHAVQRGRHPRRPRLRRLPGA